MNADAIYIYVDKSVKPATFPLSTDVLTIAKLSFQAGFSQLCRVFQGHVPQSHVIFAVEMQIHFVLSS